MADPACPLSSRNCGAWNGDRTRRLQGQQPRPPRAPPPPPWGASAVAGCRWAWMCRRIWREWWCAGGPHLALLWRTPLLLWWSSTYLGSWQKDPAANQPAGCILKMISICWNSFCHCHVYMYHSTTMFSLTKIDTNSPSCQKSNMGLQKILGKSETLSWAGFKSFCEGLWSHVHGSWEYWS